MGLENGAVSIEKKTEKEKKKEKQEAVKEIVAQIRALMRQEQATSADSSDWDEFESALTGFLNGNIKGNAATLSFKLLVTSSSSPRAGRTSSRAPRASR